MTATTAILEPHGQLSASRAFELASEFHRQGNLQEAAALYRRTLALAPGHFGALCGIGMVKGQLGQLEDGLAELREAARAAHGSADAHAGIGMILAAFDRREDAIERYHRALSINPYHGGAHYNLANALSAQGDAEAAVTHYGKALAIAPNNAAVHQNLGLALQRLGRWKQALPHHEAALRLKPEMAEAHASLGNAHRLLGHLAQAAAHYRKALQIRSDFADVHNDLAGVLHQLRQNEEAVKHYQQAITVKPAYAEAHYNLGNVLHDLGRHGDAVLHYEQALRIRPSFAEAHNNLGNALQKLGRHHAAIKRYEAAIMCKPGYAEAHRNLGNALLALNRHHDAIAAFEKALAIDPSKAAVHHDIATAHLLAGDVEGAYQAYQNALALAPRNIGLHLNLASLKPFVADDPRLPALQRLSDEAASLPENDQIALHFALGKAFSDLKMHERSFRHLLEGNRLKRGQIDYDEAATLSAFSRVREVFTPALMRQKQGAGDPSSTPVFIVGMPRSGTSLLEQILASHSRVFGAGELDAFSEAAEQVLASSADPSLQYPANMPTASAADLRRIGERYLEHVRAMAGDASRIVDKMPANFGYVGLIHLALPNARIIHARRDPIDTCLSCFGLLFGEDQPHTYDLAELGRYYSAYARLMRHWEKLLPAGIMLEMRYEDVVDDTEAQARRLIAHCGLEWEEQCLAFHSNPRPVRTASVTQVRRPIYRDSVGRWLPHKERLGPLLAALRLVE